VYTIEITVNGKTEVVRIAKGQLRAALDYISKKLDGVQYSVNYYPS